MTENAPASGRISSRMLTSCTLPLVMLMNVGMLPCRSSNVCILTAALCFRNLAHGNNERHRSMFQIDTDQIEGMKRSCNPDRNLSEVGIDAPVVRLVGIAQGGTRHPCNPM